MSKKITFILPSYKETLSIYQLILDLRSMSPSNSSIVIVDDSPGNETVQFCKNAFIESGWDVAKTKIIKNNKKNGRGHAVKIGLEFALQNFESDCFIEMDSDGSHSAKMALLVANRVPEADFCIGSRYLPKSKIIGWTPQRRFFSRIINFILRHIFTNEISDWTNGLRGYSLKSATALSSHSQLTSGFIYLSEQAVILTNGKFRIDQVAIEFKDRTFGSSTVTWRELVNSIRGLIIIIMNKSTLRKS